MKNYTVYIHRNKTNNKIYVGLTCQKPEARWRSNGQGYKSQPKFYNAIQTYGWQNFEHQILFQGLTEEEASEKEKELIQIFNSIQNGYNIDLGGTITNHSLETIEKIRNSNLGKTHSETTKQQIRRKKANVSKPVYCVETGKKFVSLGEAAQKTGIDKTSIGRCCAKKQKTAGGYHWAYQSDNNPEFQEDKRLGLPILCITTQKPYRSLKQAAKDTGIDFSNIRKACIGKYKSAGGKKWKYITLEEYEQYQGGYTENGEE